MIIDAGHYLPAIGGAINRNNKGDFNSPELSQQAKHLVSVNFKSVLIGNGLTDPLIQYKYYAKMACENEYGPVMSESECQKMESKYPTCKKLIQACYDKRNAWACIPASIKCNYDTFIQYEKTGMNPYDVRKKCEGDGGLCYELAGSVQKYMNLPEVKAELGAQREKFSNENGNVNYRFQLAGDWMLPYVDEIAPLLEDNVRILIYAGDADFVCNWMGNKAWTLDLKWSGKEEFVAANDTEWYSERAGRQGGLLRKTTDNRFAFLRVFGAGHMAPYDQPESTLDMLQQWIDGTLE